MTKGTPRDLNFLINVRQDMRETLSRAENGLYGGGNEANGKTNSDVSSGVHWVSVHLVQHDEEKGLKTVSRLILKAEYRCEDKGKSGGRGQERHSQFAT